MNLRMQKIFGALLVFVIATAGVVPSFGQSRKAARAHSFEPNEELVFVAEFSRALLKNVDVADFRFTSQREPWRHAVANGAPYSLKFTGEVSSRGFFVRLFNLKFREWMESVVEPTSFTVHRTKRIDEQGKR